MTFVIGLVTEGPNDRIVIKAVTDEVVKKLNPNPGVMYRQIQPPADRTTGGGELGGWNEVRKWCNRNPPDVRDVMVFRPSLTADPPCEVLIVQLDGDCLDEYQRFGDPLPAGPWSGRFRATYVEDLLTSWLWPNSDVPNPNSRHVLLVPVWAPETWLAAALNPAWDEPEEEDPVPELIRIRPDLEAANRPGQLRRKRVRNKYAELAESLAENLDIVRDRCNQLDRYCDRLENILIQREFG